MAYKGSIGTSSITVRRKEKIPKAYCKYCSYWYNKECVLKQSPIKGKCKDYQHYRRNEP
jgi:hypothetical protein